MAAIDLHIDNIDMDQLHRQKMQLVEALWAEDCDEPVEVPDDLWGLVHLCDAIEEKAEEDGVWVHPVPRKEEVPGT